MGSIAAARSQYLTAEANCFVRISQTATLFKSRDVIGRSGQALQKAPFGAADIVGEIRPEPQQKQRVEMFGIDVARLLQFFIRPFVVFEVKQLQRFGDELVEASGSNLSASGLGIHALFPDAHSSRL